MPRVSILIPVYNSRPEHLREAMDSISCRNGVKCKRHMTLSPTARGTTSAYAIDPTKITTELGWKPDENFYSGIVKIVEGYLKTLI